MDANDVEIGKLVEDISLASRAPPKSRTTKIKPIVSDLTSRLYESGASPDILSRLVSLVTQPGHLDQASLAAIVRNLYPTVKVSPRIIVQIIACLGHGKLKVSLNLQAALLRWLILVYHVLESSNTFSRAYAVLFNLLDTAAIRTQVSHLLALITRRRHVLPFRIQYLLALSRDTGNDPCLVGLLRVFKDYYPEIIVGEAVRGKASAFKHPDPEWRLRLDEIQEAHRQRTQENANEVRDGFRVHRPLGRLAGHGLVPRVHTSHALMDSITLEEIENASGLVKNIESLELPNQLVAALADPLLQKVLLIRPRLEDYQRISNWLSAVLQDVLDGSVPESSLGEVLGVVKDFILHIKVVPIPLLNFFTRFLQVWDGINSRNDVVEILSFAPLISFKDLHNEIYAPLEAAILDGTTESQLAILHMYTALLHSWTSALKALETPSLPQQAGSWVGTLITHVSTLAVAALQSFPTVEVESAVLDHFEQMVRLTQDEALRDRFAIALPATAVVYLLFFSGSLATTSRICNILARCKKGFETAMLMRAQTRSSDATHVSYNKAYVNTYNGYLMDICNCLWRGRAFTDAEANSHRCLMAPRAVSALSTYVQSIDKSYSLATIFSLTYSPLLSLQSITSVRELEDEEVSSTGAIRVRHAGPVTQTSLAKLATAGGLRLSWQDYRIRVLNHLTEQGFSGIADLLKNTMIVLKNAMEGKSQSVPSSQKSPAG